MLISTCKFQPENMDLTYNKMYTNMLNIQVLKHFEHLNLCFLVVYGYWMTVCKYKIFRAKYKYLK